MPTTSRRGPRPERHHVDAAGFATPQIAARVADALLRASGAFRARMLARLLRSVGLLALAVIANGAFAKYVARATSEITVSIEDAARASWDQIYELVRYVQQSHPRRLQQVLEELALGAA
jgi:hypothetical protein